MQIKKFDWTAPDAQDSVKRVIESLPADAAAAAICRLMAAASVKSRNAASAST